MHTSILSAIPVLKFNGPEGVLPGADTFKAYQDLALENFHSLVDEVNASNPGFKQAVIDSGLYEDREFVISPEIWSLGRWVDRSQGEYISNFILVAIAAERARRGQEVSVSAPLWTVNGEFFFRPGQDGQAPFKYQAPVLLDRLSMDFLSPYCEYLSNGQMGEPEDTATSNYEFDDIEKLVGHFQNALAPVEKDWDQLKRFIRDYTRHLVLKVNPNIHFSCGSTKTYVGRSVFCNGEAVPEPILAKEIVHESVHSFLYMLEELQPWMPSWDVSVRIGTNVPSVWTGNKISLVSFGQAVFVWYGLFNYWLGSIERDYYDLEMVHERLDFIRAGFEKLDLDWYQEMSEGTTPEDTIEAIKQAKNFVLSAKYQLSPA